MESIPIRSRVLVLVSLCATAMLLGSCIGVGPRPTPAPTFRGTPLTVSRADFNRYAQSLTFATDWTVSDSQPLRIAAGIGVPPRIGPWATIQAEVGTPYLSRADLERGRVIARVRSQGVHPGLGLAPGDHHIWVMVDPGTRQLVAYMVPTDLGRPATRLKFTYQRASPARPRSFFGVPRARWIYMTNPGEAGWVNCGGYCCLACENSVGVCMH